jgi:hypothetical protein
VQKWALMAAIGLAGCAAPGPGPAGVGTVTAERKAGVQAPLASGETEIVVRAVPAVSGQGQELVGAQCVAESPYFRAAFAAPARVLLPDFGPQAPAVTVTCRNGDATGTAVAQPQAAWQGGLGGWPSVGVSVGTGDYSGVGVGVGWWGGGGVGASGGTPVVRYPELRVAVG